MRTKRLLSLSTQGPRDLLERLAFRVDGVAPCDGGRRNDERRADRIAEEDPVAAAGLDQGAEQRRCGEATRARADRVEDRDGECAHFQREHLADCEIRRTRRGGGEKE